METTTAASALTELSSGEVFLSKSRRRGSGVPTNLTEDASLATTMFSSFTFPPRPPGHDEVSDVVEELEDMDLNKNDSEDD
ncbi:hypothetical protein FDP41_008569 [Naegleria fowleri]|uniref:Uncharacterized protein n=1 Tax=Naegleria fowleri TaxID=5763 RepID=A0A6A5BEZ8_NAEFO|nr:uncharacterized protein FDP41_008569 [Naegleria fowleri]KAF0973362.1 hypothetical protein FDP41_008569 [Naegleria fowleri]CAG4716554.1 unnamed protein product [Naegleria fowleri]